MKRIFLISVIGYAAASLLLTHWPAMALSSGVESAPWLAMMVVDMAFAAMAAFKLVGPSFFQEDDEDGATLHVEDVSVPDAWLYGLFGIYVLVNCGWHGKEAIFQTGGLSVYNSIWFMAEIAALLLTFIFFKNAQRLAHKAKRAPVPGNYPRKAS